MIRLLLGLSLAASAAEPKNEGHGAPAPTLDAPAAAPAAPGAAERQALLAELWQRRVLSSELDRWAPEDLALLERIRAAEREGAISDLRRAYGGLKGYAVPAKAGPARGPVELRLTKEGFDKWLFLRSQKAIEYFATRGIDQKWAFQLTDLEGRKLFEGQRGLLSAAGEAVYARITRGLAAKWLSAGVVMSNKRIKPGDAALPEAPAAPAAAPLPVGPEHPTLLDQERRAQGGRYQPVLRGSKLGRLTVILEHDPAGEQDGYIIVVARAKDKPAARAEVAKLLPHLGRPDDAHLLTVAEKTAALKASHPGLDTAGVEKELKTHLKGSLALVWALAGPPPAEEPAPEPEPEPEPAPEAAPAAAPAPAPAPAAPPR